MSAYPSTLSPFDRLVLTVALALAVAIALVIWRGDRVSMQIVAFSPEPAAQQVSTVAPIRIRFDQGVLSEPAAALAFSPPVSGTLELEGDSLIFVPTYGLAWETTYTVTLAAGLEGADGHALLEPAAWDFQTGRPQTLFARLDDQGRQQLYRAPIELAADPAPADTGDALTVAPFGIWDFTANPATGQIVFSQLNADGTSDLWSIARAGDEPVRLVECPQAACSNPAFAPDGRLLAYARRNATEFAAPAVSPARLWLLDIESGETAMVFTDDQKLGFEPHWSSDGQWLSYLAPDAGGLGVYNLEDGRSAIFTTSSGEPGIWHPSRWEFLMTDVIEGEQGYETHLYAVEPISGTKSDLSRYQFPVEDNSPAWSPDGAWIAFRRKELDGPHATMGKQLWLMRADGSEARGLTLAPEFDHGPPMWSPDGRYLLFHKLPLKGPEVVLSVWMLDTLTGDQWEIVHAGQRPQWLP